MTKETGAARCAALDALDQLARERAVPDEPGWLRSLREEARAVSAAQGIPTRRAEAWKGTSLAPLEKMSFTRIDTSAPALGEAPAGVRLLPLSVALGEAPELLEGRLGALAELKGPSLVALQTSLLEDGAVVAIGRDVRAEAPIRIRFGRQGDARTEAEGSVAQFPRLLVIAEQGAEATLLVEFEGQDAGPGLTAFVAEVFVEDGARVELVELREEGAKQIHVAHATARIGRDARFDSTALSLGEGLLRSELTTALVAPGGQTRLGGFFLGRKSGHVDHYTTVDHAAPHCTSDEEFRGVLADRAKGVFRGRVIVRPGAQKTDARQSNPNLLLSEQATIDTKPQLEIYADDVKASHGSTIGQLDADALFFLRARGLGEAEAKLLLTRGFALGVVDAIRHEALAAEIRPRVEHALARIVPTNAPAQERNP